MYPSNPQCKSIYAEIELKQRVHRFIYVIQIAIGVTKMTYIRDWQSWWNVEHDRIVIVESTIHRTQWIYNSKFKLIYVMTTSEAIIPELKSE